MFTIALDPGFGNTKVAINGSTAYVQTAVSRPREVGLATIGMKSAGREVHLVEWDMHRFYVGTGAWYRGEPLTSMDYSSLASPERMAAFYAAYALNDKWSAAELDNVQLVIGLPVPLLRDETQANIVIESLRTMKRTHAFSVDAVDYSFTVTRLLKLAQPVGAYVNWLLDGALSVRHGGKTSEVAVLDLGMNTLDLYVILDGRVAETYIGGAEVGVKRVLQMIQTNGHDITELDYKLRLGQLKPSQDVLNAWITEILASIKTTMPDLKRFDVVIPVGGGTVVAGDTLRDALISKRAKLDWPDEPITANVVGLEKFGRKHTS